jgi:preprotein translocase subunit SecA
MPDKNRLSGLKRYLARLSGGTVEYDPDVYRNTVSLIKNADASRMTGNELEAASRTLRETARSNDPSDDLLIRTFALVREAVRRMLRLDPFDEQLSGGVAMHRGRLVQMQTGEGKTLAAVFPACLNALSGKGVHVCTFNDYLARRDAEWMGPVYRFLGLSVGFVQEGMSVEARRAAYGFDVTYCTAREAGFDFLRDGLCQDRSEIVHRPFYYAIVDEADSTLIDEARVPLIIAGSTGGREYGMRDMARFARRLKEGDDFVFDEYARNICLTERGLRRAEEELGFHNLYDSDNAETISRLHCALHAEYLLRIDKDYIVRNGRVELVDEFTGRVADKRRWPEWLQAALETKENVEVRPGGDILNTITMQNFFRLYPKLCGMTATAEAAAAEFLEFYGLHVTVIPPHRPCIRTDLPDVVLPTKEAKYIAVTKEVVKAHETHRPVLVGTQSVEESALLFRMLQEKRIDCEVLNAKRDEFEAEIVARAGTAKTVTISTNMAGRGTDIRLGGADEAGKTEVSALGGLYVIGTNRHESRRIDDQLRGRAGRQGDPGSSRFFVSMEDDLFVKYRLDDLIASRFAVDPNAVEITSPVVKKEIDRVQRIIEGQNLEIKKTLCRYSAVIERQRQAVRKRRDGILLTDTFLDFYEERSPARFRALLATIGKKKLIDTLKTLSLIHLDRFWSKYLAEIAFVRESIHLTRVGGGDPLFEFHKRAVELYDGMLHACEIETIRSFERITASNGDFSFNDATMKAPSSTWTYLVNDDPFESMAGLKLLLEKGFSLYTFFLWPLTLLYYLFNRPLGGRRRKKRTRGVRRRPAS